MWQLLTVNSGYGGFGENLRMACQAASVGYTRAGTVCVGADAPLCWLCFLLIAADFRAFSEQWWSWIDQIKILIYFLVNYIHYQLCKHDLYVMVTTPPPDIQTQTQNLTKGESLHSHQIMCTFSRLIHMYTQYFKLSQQYYCNKVKVDQQNKTVFGEKNPTSTCTWVTRDHFFLCNFSHPSHLQYPSTSVFRWVSKTCLNTCLKFSKHL